MRSVLSIILIYSLAITSVFAQSVNPNDTLKIGNKSSSSDKGITFDTNDGVNNKKLLIEKISKKLKFDGNSVQLGDGSSSSDKELIIAGALKSLKYNGTTGEFEFNDDLKLSGELKSDILRAINTEVAVKSLLRAEQGIKVGTGSNEIRVNAGNLEFSNDGVLYKKIGSGTGNGGSSGISILENASFEDGITTGWTSSGGTFSQQTYTNSVEGNTKYARFVATGAGQYFETTLKAIPDNFSGGCQADFKKVNVSTGDLFKVEVLDSSLNVLTFGNVKESSWVKFPTINFPCPTAGSTVKLRVTSLAAGTIEVDDAYLGSNQNLVNVSQAKLVGALRVSGCQNSGNSTSWANFATTTGCTYTASGGISAPSTMTPSFVINNALKGDYLITFNGTVETPLGGIVGRIRLTDGSFLSSASLISAGTPTEGVSQNNPSVSFRYSRATSGSNVVINIQQMVSSASYPIKFYNPAIDSEWSVWFYPSDQDVAITPETSEWFIDANIGGATIDLGTSAQASYTTMGSASLDLVVNTSKGSSIAQIPCASGVASSGLTCSGASESVGVSFTPPKAGVYEACFKFSHLANAASTTFQLVETDDSSTIIQEGGERSNSYSSDDSAIPNKVCGTFSFSSASKKTIRLMYEQAVSTTSQVHADRNATSGQRDIHVAVRPLLSEFNRPILSKKVREIVAVSGPGLSAPHRWYEVYSDGWVRQGGLAPNPGAGAVTTINFLVEMKDLLYSSVCQSRGGPGSGLNGSYEGCSTRTTTSAGGLAFNAPEDIIVEGYGNSNAVKALGANPNY